MQRQSSADLLDLGSHCSVPACQQIDFLPFKCDCCSRIFCLQHRTYASHSCQKAESRDTNTIVCPICAKAVKLNADDDPCAVFDRHTQTDCDPTNYAKVHQRPRCPAKGCREKLGAINTYTCKECKVQVCLKHRFPEDHQCPGKAASLAGATGARASQLTQAMRGLWGNKASAPSPSGQHTQQQGGKSMLRPQSVQNRQQRPQSAQSKEQQRFSKPRPASAGTQLAEQCPQCGKGFASLQDLIVHVDVAHQQGRAPPGQGQRRADSCPHCGTTFPDAVALVRHVERSHSGQSQCRLS